MPGAPTSRGCDACRKHKKKCDQARPACSRYSRLKIACVGCGQVRYKFVDHSAAGDRPNKALDNVALRRQNGSPSPIPSNQTTARLSAFISLLEVSDLRYALSCYGGWFKELPSRLGANQALDAAVDAMAGFYPYLWTRQISRNSVVKYVGALQALRTCMKDPKKARDPETLCAIYIIMICQGWTGRDHDQKMTHGEGLAHLLDATESRACLDKFETLMRDTLYVPVILDSIFNPRIQASPWFLKLKAKVYGPPPPLNGNTCVLSLELASLVKISDFIRDPIEHMKDIQFSYQRMRNEIPLLKKTLEQVDELVSCNERGEPSPSSLARIRLQCQTSWGLLLASALIFNGLLRALGADDGYMVGEAMTMVKEVIALAENVSQCRPLGASFMPVCLVPAWAVIEDQEVQQKVVKQLEAHVSDFTPIMGRGWHLVASWLKGQMNLVRCGLPTTLRIEDDQFLETTVDG